MSTKSSDESGDIANQGLVWKNRQLDMTLLPWCLQDLKGSILRILNNKIGKYDRDMSGMIISYKNVTVLQNFGSIRHDSAEIHADVKVNFLVFQPTVGSKAIGVINKKCVTHLSVLTHKIFNVVIPRPTDDMNIKWIGDTLDVGQKVPFTIVVLDLFGALPYIRGELNEELLNSGTFINTNSLQYEQSKINVASVNFDEIKPKTRTKQLRNDNDDTEIKQTNKRKRETSDDETGEDEPSKKILKKNSIKTSDNNISNTTKDDSSSSSDDDLPNSSVQSEILRKMKEKISKSNDIKKQISKKNNSNVSKTSKCKSKIETSNESDNEPLNKLLETNSTKMNKGKNSKTVKDDDSSSSDDDLPNSSVQLEILRKVKGKPSKTNDSVNKMQSSLQHSDSDSDSSIDQINTSDILKKVIEAKLSKRKSKVKKVK